MENKKMKRKDLRHKVIDFLSKEGNKLTYIKPMDDHPDVLGGMIEVDFYNCFNLNGDEVFYFKSVLNSTEIVVKKMSYVKGVPGLIKAVCIDEGEEINLYVSCISPIQISDELFEEELNEKDPSLLLYIEDKKEFPFMLHVLKKGYLQKTILESVSKRCLSILNKQNYKEGQYNLFISRYGVKTTDKGSMCVIEVTCSLNNNKEDEDKSFSLLYQAPIMYVIDLSKKRNS